MDKYDIRLFKLVCLIFSFIITRDRLHASLRSKDPGRPLLVLLLVIKVRKQEITFAAPSTPFRESCKVYLPSNTVLGS